LAVIVFIIIINKNINININNNKNNLVAQTMIKNTSALAVPKL